MQRRALRGAHGLVVRLQRLLVARFVHRAGALGWLLGLGGQVEVTDVGRAPPLKGLVAPHPLARRMRADSARRLHGAGHEAFEGGGGGHWLLAREPMKPRVPRLEN